MEHNYVSVNDLPDLKRAYNKAVEEEAEQFTFKGATLVVGYAKYLIEYLENLLKQAKNN